MKFHALHNLNGENILSINLKENLLLSSFLIMHILDTFYAAIKKNIGRVGSGKI